MFLMHQRHCGWPILFYFGHGVFASYGIDALLAGPVRGGAEPARWPWAGERPWVAERGGSKPLPFWMIDSVGRVARCPLTRGPGA
ncbi:MAG: hypothetical protein QOG28_5309 [Trebonia sp.]|nr:hypothetical protein [Trebonia sp.]